MEKRKTLMSFSVCYTEADLAPKNTSNLLMHDEWYIKDFPQDFLFLKQLFKVMTRH